ncbi:MAG TPA: phosphate acyltransferase PlsX, partial [Gemmatimonadaceae bacterium]
DVHVVQLVGRTSVIEKMLGELLKGELSDHALQRDRISLVDAPDTISMSDKPTTALRSGSNNPMSVGIRLQAEDASDAFVSAGSTGAQMAASALLLGRLTGVTRPAIATVFPTARQPIVVLDSGANVDCSPHELVQFAWLGSVYAEFVLGRARPVVGLLSNGEEKEKGNTTTKAAYVLFRAAGFNFQGNVEGRDLPAGASDRGPIDVVVCDGFVGNVVLKFYEAVMPMIVALLTAVPSFDQSVLEAALGPLDSTSYGGAPLLGVRGVSIICHGNSSPRAIKNAIKVAVRAVETRMNEHIEERLMNAATSLNSGQVA